MKLKPLSFLIMGIVLTGTGCTRNLTSEPDLKKWTESVKNKKPSLTHEMPTLSKFEVFSYKDHMTKVIDPNPATAVERAQANQTTVVVQAPEDSDKSNPDKSNPDKSNPDNLDDPLKTDPASTASLEKPSLETSTTDALATNLTTKLRNPFSLPSDTGKQMGGLRPDPNRPREPLESFPLDALKMVGTIGGGHKTALLRAPDKIVYRVNVGQHLGQSDGKVVSVQPGEIILVELVTDGSGGWIEREASILME